MKFYINLILTFWCFALFGQQNINPEDFKALKFRNIGPAGMSGRITAIDVDPFNENHIFIGAASGGVWKSENGGITWNPIFDEMNTLAIGALKINPKNPAEIWVGTGEGNPRNSHNAGAGIFKSIDGGKTWKYMGLKETKLIHRIIINEMNTDEVLIGALGSAWGPTEDRGVYKTKDGGASWERILYVNDETGVGDMVMDPQNPNKVLAAMWEFGRKPWTFNSGGDGSGLHLTYDGGVTWKKLGKENGLPESNIGRVGLAIAPSTPNIIYALIESKKNALYKSEDGGENWKKISDKNIGNRPFYYAEIYVDPSNENRIFNLWSYVSKSEDGGKTFKTIMDYGNNIHPDHHAFWISKKDPSYMINGNDGGLNISRDGGKNWRFVSNIPVGQFYHISADNDFPYHVYGGMQDNGSWIGPGFALKRGGIRNGDWSELYFGDGFDVQSRRDNSRYGYAMSQGGHMGMYDRETGAVKYIRPQHPDGEVLRFNWNAALALDPYNDCGLYYGSQYVHYSNDCGSSWKVLSPDLTTNDTIKQKQHLSGGLTIDDTDAENNTCILSIAPSTLDSNIIWVGTDDGLVHMTNNGGSNWEEMTNRIPELPESAFITQIHSSVHDANEVFIVANNYRMNDWSAYLFYSSDGGKRFTRLVNDDQVKGFVLSVVQDPVAENLLFLGTDVGLYVSFDKGDNWTHWTEGMPPVQIRDMVIQDQFSDLVIGTFGRSIWVMDQLEVLREIAMQEDVLEDDFLVFTPEDAYKTYKRSVDGMRFIAQAEFVGENNYKGAQFYYWNKPSDDDGKLSKKDKVENTQERLDTKAKEKNPVDKKLRVYILDQSEDTIRTIVKKEVKPGLNMISWGMDAESVNWPSRTAPKEDTEPGGMPIMPGKYKAIFNYLGHQDSTEINVMVDPRVKGEVEHTAAKVNAVKAFNAEIEKATKAFSALQSARKSIGIVKKMLELEHDTVVQNWKAQHKALLSKIDSLELEYMLPKDVKGYQDSDHKLNTYLYRARRYLTSSWGTPSDNASYAVDRAVNKMRAVVEEINSFLEGEFKSYQESVNSSDFKLFEDFEKIKLD